MNIEKEKRRKFHMLEITRWVGVISLIIFAVVGNNFYCDKYNFFFRLIIVFFAIFIAAYIAYSTTIGKLIVIFGKESFLELKQVVWPTYRESLHTTLIVIMVTIVVSLIVWGLDTILLHIISFSLGL